MGTAIASAEIRENACDGGLADAGSIQVGPALGSALPRGGMLLYQSAPGVQGVT
jgi:hypothetical protein